VHGGGFANYYFLREGVRLSYSGGLAKEIVGVWECKCWNAKTSPTWKE